MSWSLHFRNPVFLTLSALVAAGLLGLAAEIKRQHVRPVERRCVELVPFSRLPLPQPGAGGAFRDSALALAVGRTVERLSHMDTQRVFRWDGGSITAGELRHGLEQFLEICGQAENIREFRQRARGLFDVYRVRSCDGGKEAPRHPVLVTGYFQPELQASLNRSQVFSYPVYGVPEDMLRIDLRLFDPALPARRLMGRVAGSRVVPYYTRSEIDSGQKEINAPVLAWLSSPVDGLMLHIQGSGLLRLQDGSTRYIHFAASNGRPYGSIGRWLIKRGWLRPENADWPGIRDWAMKHPDRFRQALEANPRYIFFRWEREGPVGSLGAVLVPMRSVALDQGRFPPGALCLLDLQAAGVAGMNGQHFRGFVLNQDSGSAIKGPCRLDLYCGHGEKAGEIAGRLRHRGDLYVLMPRRRD